MQWNELTTLEHLQKISSESTEQKILIFKHSTSCSISRAVLGRLERSWNSEEMKAVKPYFLDLLRFREISNSVAEKFNVKHESPQAIVIENNKPVYAQSHFDISYNELKDVVGGNASGQRDN
ncbi:MAG: bacillithiol system redox-active protein YtxJ [Cyclobacteriaceae bacterium]|nr:bacillithiol system redox-active protein YtxJ [Cyclobacteriaceae bacterium]